MQREGLFTLQNTSGNTSQQASPDTVQVCRPNSTAKFIPNPPTPQPTLKLQSDQPKGATIQVEGKRLPHCTAL